MNTIRPDCRTIHLPKEKKAAKGEPWNPELVNLEQNSIASICSSTLAYLQAGALDFSSFYLFIYLDMKIKLSLTHMPRISISTS